ncbi:MAG: hypothetical protein ACI9S8_000778 [Chlamydiales bacterium]|jgi:hypothetical protein
MSFIEVSGETVELLNLDSNAKSKALGKEPDTITRIVFSFDQNHEMNIDDKTEALDEAAAFIEKKYPHLRSSFHDPQVFKLTEAKNIGGKIISRLKKDLEASLSGVTNPVHRVAIKASLLPRGLD